MATLNFPDAPDTGDIYTDSNSGFTYEWNGTVWISKDPSTASNIREINDISGDFNGSTTVLIKYTKKYNAPEFIVITEPVVIHQMKKASPHKNYIPLANTEGCACNECPHMRLNTIDKMIQALETLSPEIILNDTLIHQAKKPLIKMLELS